MRCSHFVSLEDAVHCLLRFAHRDADMRFQLLGPNPLMEQGYGVVSFRHILGPAGELDADEQHHFPSELPCQGSPLQAWRVSCAACVSICRPSLVYLERRFAKLCLTRLLETNFPI